MRCCLLTVTVAAEIGYTPVSAKEVLDDPMSGNGLLCPEVWNEWNL